MKWQTKRYPIRNSDYNANNSFRWVDKHKYEEYKLVAAIESDNKQVKDQES